jgi:cell division protein FtsZ
MFGILENSKQRAKIKVIGVGGAGGNAVNRMIASGLSGVEFIAANTDVQVLSMSKADVKTQLGVELTKGLGSGGDPDVGRRAIEENAEDILDAIRGADMLFITAGLGGGTGTGASPRIAEIARDNDILTVAIVTRPFEFEGTKRSRQAGEGEKELRDRVDTLIVIPNQRLLSVVGRQTPICEAFRICDEVLLQATKGISDLITVPGLVNLDFADVRTIMSETGEALMGTGTGSGENRAQAAATEAISCPLLEDVSIEGAKGILVNVTGGPDMTLHEVDDASTVISEAAGKGANLIFGAVIDESAKDSVHVTVIATGLPESRREQVAEFIEAAQTDISSLTRQRVLEAPTFRRKDVLSERRILQKADIADFSADDLEIPTFMRRQMD